MPSAQWPSFERILEIDKIYTSTAQFNNIPSELMDVIKRNLGCADYIHLRQTSHDNNQAVEDHHCERMKIKAAEAIDQVLESNPSPETIDYEFVTRLNTEFSRVFGGDGGGGAVTLPLFYILEIVGYAAPEKLQEISGFKFRNIRDVRGLCRVLRIKGLNFKTVDLQHNEFGIEGAKALASAIRESASLTSVNLIHSQVGPEGAKALASAIEESTSITSINLEENFIGPKGAEALAPAIRKLTSINLRRNNLGREGAKALAHAIRDRTSKLSECNVRGNSLDASSAKELAKIATKKGVTLFGIQNGQTEADFSNRSITSVDAILIANDLVVTGSVTSLNLSWNNLRAEGANALAHAIRGKASLADLNLANNDIGGHFKDNGDFIQTPEGTIAIANALCVNASLTSINLAGNRLGPEDAEALAPAIRDSASLTSIDLSGNHIREQGANALVPAIQNSASLTSIYLGCNDLGPEGAKAFAPALRDSPSLACPVGGGTYWKPWFGSTCIRCKANKSEHTVKASLTAIDLSANKLGPEGAKALAPAIHDSASLTSINLFRNSVGVEGEALLRAAVEGRPGFELRL